MKKQTKCYILNTIGIFFLFISISSIITSFYRPGIAEAIWMCYISTALIGLGLIYRKGNIILAQIYILTIPLIIWNIDFFYQLITNTSLWGITDYFFANKNFTFENLLSLQHLITIPLTLYSIFLIKIKNKNSEKIAFIQIFIVYFATLALTTQGENANCAFEPCMNLGFEIPFYIYSFVWFASYSIIITLTYYLLNMLKSFKNSYE